MALKFSNHEIQLINIYIGLVLRHTRLSAKISQHDISISCGIDSTAIGRIERAEHMSNWSSIYLLSKFLNIEFSKLFILKEKDEFLDIINSSYKLETKLSNEKKRYYKNLVNKVNELFVELNKSTN